MRDLSPGKRLKKGDGRKGEKVAREMLDTVYSFIFLNAPEARGLNIQSKTMHKPFPAHGTIRIRTTHVVCTFE